MNTIPGLLAYDKVYRNLLTSSSRGVKSHVRLDVHLRIKMNLLEVDQKVWGQCETNLDVQQQQIKVTRGSRL
jgi:hypothetical protein